MLMDPSETPGARVLARLRRRVRPARQQRFDAMNGCLTDFLDDLLNYPLLRPWRESLDHFQEHYWEQLGLRLTPESYQIVVAIIERAVNDPSCFAYGPIQPDATGVVTSQPMPASWRVSR